MPIVKPDDSPRPAPKPVIAQIAKPNYKGTTVDSKVEAPENLLSHIEGSSWTVRYFSAVRDLDGEVIGQNQTVSGANQQYRQIRDLELKVTSALSASQDATTKQLTYRGAASMYPFLIPNTGDMFIADIGQGREGIFEISISERKSVFKQTVHDIEYRMVDYANDTRVSDLEKKTVQVLYYDRDFHQYGQNPLLFEEEHGIIRYIREQISEQTRRYFKSFFSREFSTLLIPGQDPVVYDPFIVRACLSSFEMNAAEQMQFIRSYNTNEDTSLRATSIWDAIKNRSIDDLDFCFVEYGTVGTSQFHQDAMLYSLRYSGIGFVIYPMDPMVSVDYIRYDNKMSALIGGVESGPDSLRKSTTQASTDQKNLSRFFRGDVVDGLIATDEDGNGVENPLPPPLINPAMADNCYIFSRAFYENNTTPRAMSQLEIQLRKYLRREKVDAKYIKLLIQDMRNWTAMDRFYYTPVLLILMNSIIRDI